MSASDGQLSERTKAVVLDRYAEDAFKPSPLRALLGGRKYVPGWRERARNRWYRMRAWVATKVLRVYIGDDE